MLNQKSFYLAVSVAVSGSAYADVGHGPKIGTATDASKATRIVEIEMRDNSYNHEEINVREGEVVRFVIHNNGQLVHEFNIGTADMHDAHQDEMLAMMESGQMSPTHMNHGHEGMMAHDHPNSVLLSPGETKELVWKFTEAHKGIEFACNVPGHYQAGMVGQFQFEDS